MPKRIFLVHPTMLAMGPIDHAFKKIDKFLWRVTGSERQSVLSGVGPYLQTLSTLLIARAQRVQFAVL